MNNLQTLDGKRLFLTGGTGFLGKNLLRLLEQAHSTLQITLLSRDPERFDRAYPHFRKHLNLTFLKGDIRTFPFPDGNFDFILHGATDADAVMIREQPEEMYSVIVDGTRHLLDFSEKSTSPRLLYLSSGAVYGPQDQGVPFVSETCPPLPETCYGKGKRDAEELCLNSGITCCIARCFTLSGPDLPLDRHYALGNFVADAAAKRPIVVKGDGRTVRSYLDSRDLAGWLFHFLQNAPPGTICNAGSDIPITIRELAERVRTLSGADLPILVQKSWDGRPSPRYVPDLTRAKAFGLKQRISLDSSICDMLAEAVRPIH